MGSRSLIQSFVQKRHLGMLILEVKGYDERAEVNTHGDDGGLQLNHCAFFRKILSLPLSAAGLFMKNRTSSDNERSRLFGLGGQGRP